MIILEGPDNSGKSTLAKKLNEIMDWPVEHSGGPTTHEDRHIRMMEVMEKSEVIMDRVPCISEPIYGSICRGINCFEGTKYLENLLKNKPIIIYCRPPTSVIINIEHELSKYANKDHLDMVEDNKFAIVGAYDTLMSNIPHIYYDWTATTPNHFLLLISYCNLYKERVNERRSSKQQPHSRAGSKRRSTKSSVQKTEGINGKVSPH